MGMRLQRHLWGFIALFDSAGCAVRNVAACNGDADARSSSGGAAVLLLLPRVLPRVGVLGHLLPSMVLSVLLMSARA